MLSVARVRLEILGNIGEFTPFLAGPHTRRITHARPEAWDFFFFPAKWRVNAVIPRRLIRPIKQTRSLYYSL